MGGQVTVDREALHEVKVPRSGFELSLLGGFELRNSGAVVQVALSSQRLLAYLALMERPQPRAHVAGALWPETTDEKAGANLRTALWRLAPHGDVVTTSLSCLVLRSEVWVDVRYVHQTAQRVLGAPGVHAPAGFDRMRGELLPGFWDSWLVFERERLRQECIHINEACCLAALRSGEGFAAVLAALAAVECDPVREASNALLIRAYLLDGDRARARRHLDAFASLLDRELGVAPAVSTLALLAEGPREFPSGRSVEVRGGVEAARP